MCALYTQTHGAVQRLQSWGSWGQRSTWGQCWSAVIHRAKVRQRLHASGEQRSWDLYKSMYGWLKSLSLVFTVKCQKIPHKHILIYCHRTDVSMWCNIPKYTFNCKMYVITIFSVMAYNLLAFLVRTRHASSVLVWLIKSHSQQLVNLISTKSRKM